jgi:hypothetical protein
LGRSQTSRQRFQTLVPYSPSTATFVRLWIQFFLPNSGQDAWIQHDCHPRDHVPAIFMRWSFQRCPRLVLRTEEREVLAYCRWNGGRSYWFHHGCSVTQHWGSIRIPVPVCHWCILVSTLFQRLVLKADIPAQTQSSSVGLPPHVVKRPKRKLAPCLS